MLYSPIPTWLYPQEQTAVVGKLLEWNLIKFSNLRDLSLKSGGKTDIYINLREARNYPEAIKYFANLFSHALRRIPGLDNFIEVPDSVSCFAGCISQYTNLPYLTIRSQSKEGRVSDARVIGQAKFGQNTAIIDDVITDGASKILPFQICEQYGMIPKALIVLVDRQQGWKEFFQDQCVDPKVWPGMFLHDVRALLINIYEVMQRCDPVAEEKNRIILALDGKNIFDVMPLVDTFRPTGCIFKVNDLVFNHGIFKLIPELNVYGRVMVDLKCHDIPNTVANTCQHLAFPWPSPWAVTVHASGGEEMIKAAVHTLKDSETSVLAVTVLTSIDPATCDEIYHRQPWDQVKQLAHLAQKAGAHGLVCSPEEVAALRQEFPPDKYPNFILVTPGVRSAGQEVGDQKRTGTPAQAVRDGADYLVMGRQIMGSPDPVAEYHRVMTEELGIK